MNNKQFYLALFTSVVAIVFLSTVVYVQTVAFSHFDEKLGVIANKVNTPPVAIETTLPNQTVGTKTFANQLLGQVQFEFPETWSSYTKENADGMDITTADLGPGQLGECSGCGGYVSQASVSLLLTRYPAADHVKRAASLDDVLKEIANNGGSIIKRTDTQLPNGLLVDLDINPGTCSEVGCVMTPEKLVFVPKSNTATQGIIIQVSRNQADPLTEAGWKLIKSTLDFSWWQ